MNIEVRNLSSSGAIISWTANEPCQEDYYHVMYKANWNTNIFAGYIRNSFHYEEKVPKTVTRVALEHLAPSTFYYLCVSCKRITYHQNPYCKMFYTPDQNPLIPRGYLVSPHVSLWVILAILLAGTTAVLAFIGLQYLCGHCHVPRWSYRGPHAVEANGLVRWPGDGQDPDQDEEDQQGLPLMERPRRDSGAGVEPEAEAADADAAIAVAPAAVPDTDDPDDEDAYTDTDTDADASEDEANADADDSDASDSDAPDSDAPDEGAPQKEGGGQQPGILPHLEEGEVGKREPPICGIKPSTR